MEGEKRGGSIHRHLSRLDHPRDLSLGSLGGDRDPVAVRISHNITPLAGTVRPRERLLFYKKLC